VWRGLRRDVLVLAYTKPAHGKYFADFSTFVAHATSLLDQCDDNLSTNAVINIDELTVPVDV
jgi:hypothetical protein